MPKGITNDLTGKRFGKLTVLQFDESSFGKGRKWLCQCDCGNTKIIRAANLINGSTVSCGCERGKASKHGECRNGTETHLYRVWGRMKERCYNQKREGYHRYGGRGIKVCDEWLNDFEVFKTWALANGYKRHLQIDRKDSNGNYEPGNCRFVTGTDNTRNQEQVKLTVEKVREIKRKLRSQSCNELALQCGVSAATIRAIKRGDRWADVS